MLFHVVGYENMENAEARNVIKNGGKVYMSDTVCKDMGALSLAVCNSHYAMLANLYCSMSISC